VRIRVALGLAVLVVVGALVLDMSGSARRTAGSDHFNPLLFTATLANGGSACQPLVSLPRDAAQVLLTIGTYGKPTPPLTLRFTDPSGQVSAEGHLAAGAHEGLVLIPVHDRSNPEAAREACLQVGAGAHVAIGGEGVPVSPESERVNGTPDPGRISLFYYRAGSDSWWQLLPALDERFGLGKASFMGGWLLPVAALALLGVWVAALRLLARQLLGVRTG
jgi:hypothetical protein